MAINWNMDIGSLGDLLKKKKTGAHASDALVYATKKVWRSSIIFLALFAIVVVAYDAYIFWEYVYNQQEVDVSGQSSVEGINRSLFDSVVRTLDGRTKAFEGAKTAEPIRNPFVK